MSNFKDKTVVTLSMLNTILDVACTERGCLPKEHRVCKDCTECPIHAIKQAVLFLLKDN